MPISRRNGKVREVREIEGLVDVGGEGVLYDAIFEFDSQFGKRARFLGLHGGNRSDADGNRSDIVLIAKRAKDEEPGVEARAGE